jgi:hypothetical protein
LQEVNTKFLAPEKDVENNYCSSISIDTGANNQLVSLSDIDV